MQLPHAGQRFANRYDVHQQLGQGAFGAVYRATDRTIGRDVAIKVLLPGVMPGTADYPEMLKRRFAREARVLAQLRSPHTITLYEAGESEGLLYMAFEFVQGRELDAYILAGGMAEPHANLIMRHVLRSLYEAHHVGVLHRDIKPANILVTEGEEGLTAKVLDFGIAKFYQDEGQPGRTVMTQAGSILGTPAYMSPEQIAGEPMTPASDLYSLGIVYAELLQGRHLIDGATPALIMQRHLEPGPMALPADFRGSPQARYIVEKLTQRRREDRFQTAEEVLQLLSGPDASGMSPSAGPRPAAAAGAPPTHSTMGRHPESTVVERTDRPASGSGKRVLTWFFALLGLGVFAGAAWLLASPAPAPDIEPTTSVEPLVAEPPPVPTAVDREPDVGDEVTVVAEEQKPKADADPVEGSAELLPISGCGDEPPFVGERSATLDIGGVQRSYRIHVPKQYDPNRPYPLLIAFHNEGGSSRSIYVRAGLEELSDREDVIVIAPTSAGVIQLLLGAGVHVWNDSGDIPLVRRLLESVQTNFCVDRQRIYLLGDGGGGKLAENLPCEVPVAAVASLSFRGDADDVWCETPVPYLHLSGTKDEGRKRRATTNCAGRPIVPYDQKLKAWRNRNGCTEERSRSRKEKNGTCFEYDCEHGALAVCDLEGGGGWMTGDDVTAPGFEKCARRATDFPHTEVIWDFLSTHKLGSEL